MVKANCDMDGHAGPGYLVGCQCMVQITHSHAFHEVCICQNTRYNYNLKRNVADVGNVSMNALADKVHKQDVPHTQ